MAHILIFCEEPNQALHYVLDFISMQFQDLHFELTGSKEKFIASTQAKINYHAQPLSNKEIWIINNNYLQNVLQIPYPEFQNKGIQFIIFPDQGGSTMGFELFTALFWMLTNYEERYSEQRDMHGRFLFEQSIQFEAETIHIPIVDVWIEKLVEHLELLFDLKLRRATAFNWSIGVDVDHPWKYKYKPIIKQVGAVVRSLINLDFANYLERMEVHLSMIMDPFDTWDHFEKIPKEHLIFFILKKTGTALDSSHALHSTAYRALLQKLDSKFAIGLHPSYFSIEHDEFIAKEKQELETVIHQEVFRSRQHYLRMKIPDTYRRLQSAGILEDYSMLFADHCGFRTGTTHPYRFFDVEANEIQKIVIQPVVAMDRTLLKYQHCSAEEALNTLQLLIDQCRHFQGHCHIIWHNSSFDFRSDWKGWESVFNRLIGMLA